MRLAVSQSDDTLCRAAIPRVNVLGVGVSALDMASAIESIDSWIQRGASQYVCVTGVHGVMESLRDPNLRKIHNRTGLVTTDGMPLVWISRLAGYRYVQRVCGPDLMLAFCRYSAPLGYRHFLYGGGEGVAEQLAASLCARIPGLRIVGTLTPPFRPLSAKEGKEVVERINASEPDLVWVGLSTPKQERWMYEHVELLNAPVLLGVGAAFDFHAGLKVRAPHWMQQSGLEWLFRLLREPHRLWRRYLINNPLFIGHILCQATGLRRYDLRPEPQVGGRTRRRGKNWGGD